MSAPLPVFHIGANKAGSTTLQRALFARHAGVLSLAKPDPVPAAEQAVAAVLEACDSRKPDRRVPGDEVAALWRKAIAAAADRVPVFSREELIRYYFYGQPDPDRLPKAVAAMAGPVRVVLVIRHQVRLIESLYVHNANAANFKTPEQFLGDNPERFAYGYRFGEIAEAWMRVMGEENVGVFLFEELVNDSDAFARRLCGFIGVDAQAGRELLANRHENVRKSERIQTYARLRSAFFPDVSFGEALPGPLRRAWRSYLEGGERARAELPADWLARIVDYYAPDNRRLAARFGLPLQDYGYPL